MRWLKIVTYGFYMSMKENDMGIYKRRDNIKSCDLKKVMAFFVPGREF